MQTAFLKSYYYSKEKSNSTKPFVFGSETGIGVCLTCIPLLLFLQKPQGGKLIQHTFRVILTATGDTNLMKTVWAVLPG